MKNQIASIFLILFAGVTFAQNQVYSFSINETEKFNKEIAIALGNDWQIFNYSFGDITNDKRNDIIAIGKSTKNEFQNRKIYLFVCLGEHLFELRATNENILECSICGVDGIKDAFEKLLISNHKFSFEFRYGSGWPLIIKVYFKYDTKKKDWFLTKELEIAYGSGSSQNGKVTIDKSEPFKKHYNKMSFENFKLQ